MLLDLAVVLCYSLVMLTVGWRSRRQSPQSFWVAGRQHGTSRISASLIVTVFGASATMGVIGLGYSRGLTGAWWPLTGALALIPFAFFLAGRVRNLAVYTLPDILDRAYGRKVAVPAGLMIAVSWCGVIAAQMVAGALLLSGVFEVGYGTSLTITAVVFIVYTFWGGQLSVVRTDLWQLLLFVGGLATCLLILAVRNAGSSIDESVLATHLQFPVSSAFGWYDLLVHYPLIVGLPFLVGPDLWSRVLCARDDTVAKRSVLIAAAAIVPLAIGLALLGIMIRLQFPGITPDGALPEAIRQLLPVGLKGLIVAGFLAAIMSSADTTLVTAATIFSLNVMAPLGGSSRSDRLTNTKFCLVVVGTIAWLIAAFQQGIISALLLGYTIYVGGVVVPTVASFYRDKLGITSVAAMWAVVTGGSFAILGEIQDGSVVRTLVGEQVDAFLNLTLGYQYHSILPLVLSLGVLIGVSRICGKSSSPAK